MLLFPDAKVNLGLNVVSRRPDGYHNLVTLMLPIPSNDILEIVPSASGKGDTLTCTGRTVDCPMERNLVYKALQRLRAQFLIPPVDIYLEKQTPDGAGLGGGSADAAYTLKALNSIFNLGASDQLLAQTAAEIGADCPFFIYDRPTLCTGTGTTMEPFPLDLPRGMWIVLVKPDVSVSTAQAYGMLTPREPATPLQELLRLPIEQWQGKVLNDFEPGITAKFPVIGQIKQLLLDAGAIYASMSGSGSAVYGLFSGEPSEQDIKPLTPLGCYLVRKIS